MAYAAKQEPGPYQDLYTIVEEHVPTELIRKVRGSVIGIELEVAESWMEVERRIYLGLVRHLPGLRAVIRDVFESIAFVGCATDPGFYDRWEDGADGY